jgi:predicted DNA binding CopG/RHH family protein
MLLTYQPKQEHIKDIPLIPISAEAKKVTLTRNQLQLLPGTNEISDDEWTVIKDHIKKDIENKIIVPIEKNVTPSKRAPDGKAKNLKELPSQEAVAFVQKCNNPESLVKWYQEETREEVRFQITEKMKELKIDIPKLDNKPEDDEDAEVKLEDMTKDQLVAYAAEKKITVNASGTAEEILAAIKKAQAK